LFPTLETSARWLISRPRPLMRWELGEVISIGRSGHPFSPGFTTSTPSPPLSFKAVGRSCSFTELCPPTHSIVLTFMVVAPSTACFNLDLYQPPPLLRRPPQLNPPRKAIPSSTCTSHGIKPFDRVAPPLACTNRSAPDSSLD